MGATSTPGRHWPSNTVLVVLMVLAAASVIIDVIDADWPKMTSSLLLLVGLGALLQARRFESSRWRMVSQVAMALALAMLLVRLAIWQGWV